jgi:hypothetical protein
MVPKYCTVLILLFIGMFRLVRQAYLRLRMGMQKWVVQLQLLRFEVLVGARTMLMFLRDLTPCRVIGRP